jgi:hypothetical protein
VKPDRLQKHKGGKPIKAFGLLNRHAGDANSGRFAAGSTLDFDVRHQG